MLAPNDGAPVGFAPIAPPLNCDCGSGGTPLPMPPVDELNIDARNGLAAPPVICGRKPTPTVDVVAPPMPAAPAGWAFKAPKPPALGEDDADGLKLEVPNGGKVEDLPDGEDNEVPREPRDGPGPVGPFKPVGGGEDVPEGVGGLDCGIGGSDSSNDAPNEDVGLNALRPVKPVACGWRGAVEEKAGVAAVLPVGWLENADAEVK